MDFSNQGYLYNRPVFLQNASDSSLSEVEEQSNYNAPFAFSHLAAASPRTEQNNLPFNAMSANLFLQPPAVRQDLVGKEEGLSQAASFYAPMDTLPNSFGLDMSMVSLQEQALDPMLDQSAPSMNTALPRFYQQEKEVFSLRQNGQQQERQSLPSPTDRLKRAREVPSPLRLTAPIFGNFDEREQDEAQLMTTKRTVRGKNSRTPQTKGSRGSTKVKDGERDLETRRKSGTEASIPSPEYQSSAELGNPSGLRAESPRSKQRRDQEDLERILHNDQDLHRDFPGAESWQGDWHIAEAATQAHIAQNHVQLLQKGPCLDNTHSAGSIQPFMTAEERRKLEASSQQLFTTPLAARNAPHCTNSVKVSEGNADGTYGLSINEAYFPTDRGTQLPKANKSGFFPPHSAPPNFLAYPSGMVSVVPARNSIFNFASDSTTQELGWQVEQQNSRFQTSPLLNAKVNFPTRPLIPGVLAKIHNEWLDEYPEPQVPEAGASQEEGVGARMQPAKRFPTPQVTFESQHIRTLWQELERRRILEMADANLMARLRREATTLLKVEALSRGSIGCSNEFTEEQLLNAIPDPSEEQINNRVRMLWEQTKRSAVYAVGLLRQAEYCIAHGHLGFMPLNHIRRGTTVGGQASTSASSASAAVPAAAPSMDSFHNSPHPDGLFAPRDRLSVKPHQEEDRSTCK